MPIYRVTASAPEFIYGQRVRENDLVELTTLRAAQYTLKQQLVLNSDQTPLTPSVPKVQGSDRFPVVRGTLNLDATLADMADLFKGPALTEYIGTADYKTSPKSIVINLPPLQKGETRTYTPGTLDGAVGPALEISPLGDLVRGVDRSASAWGIARTVGKLKFERLGVSREFDVALTLTGYAADLPLPALPLATGVPMIIVGDSLTGYGVNGGAPNTNLATQTLMYGFTEWTRALDQRVNMDTWFDADAQHKQGYSGSNDGIFGDHLEYVASNPAYAGGGIIPRVVKAISRKPGIILLEGGSNTINSGDDGVNPVSVDYMIRELDAGLRLCRAAGIWCILMIINPRNDFPAGGPQQALIEATNVWIRAQAGREGVRILDPEPSLKPGGVFDSLCYFGDKIHFNHRGAWKVAKNHLVPIIQELVAAGTIWNPDVTVQNLLPASMARLQGTTGTKLNGALGNVAAGASLNNTRNLTSLTGSKEVISGDVEAQVMDFVTGNTAGQPYWQASLSFVNMVFPAVPTGGRWMRMSARIETSGAPSVACSRMNYSFRTPANVALAGNTAQQGFSPDFGVAIDEVNRSWTVMSMPVFVPEGCDRLALGFDLYGDKTSAAFKVKIHSLILREIPDPRPAFGFAGTPLVIRGPNSYATVGTSRHASEYQDSRFTPGFGRNRGNSSPINWMRGRLRALGKSLSNLGNFAGSGTRTDEYDPNVNLALATGARNILMDGPINDFAQAYPNTFSGSVAGNVLTLTTDIAGPGIKKGGILTGAGVTANTKVIDLLSGAAGKAGATYSLSNSMTVAAVALTVTGYDTVGGAAVGTYVNSANVVAVAAANIKAYVRRINDAGRRVWLMRERGATTTSTSLIGLYSDYDRLMSDYLDSPDELRGVPDVILIDVLSKVLNTASTTLSLKNMVDGVHDNVDGARTIGFAMADILAPYLAFRAGHSFRGAAFKSQDSKRNLIAVPDLSGTVVAGGTGNTGNVPTGFTTSQSGGATAVFSIENAPADADGNVLRRIKIVATATAAGNVKAILTLDRTNLVGGDNVKGGFKGEMLAGATGVKSASALLEWYPTTGGTPAQVDLGGTGNGTDSGGWVFPFEPDPLFIVPGFTGSAFTNLVFTLDFSGAGTATAYLQEFWAERS